MALIDEIRDKVSRSEFEFSRYALEQTIRRDTTVTEVRECIASGEIIEDDPDDKYGPSCLIFGRIHAGRPLHVQCSYPSRPIIKVVTIYEPDPNQWVDLRTRKP